MLLMGDELSRTQNGNNNAYAQDNETSWLDWEEGLARDPGLCDFVRTLVRFRLACGAFRRRSFHSGAVLPGSGLKDVYWLAPEGREMTEDDWAQEMRRALGVQIGNESHADRRFLILMNAAPEDVTFKLPADFPAGAFVPVLDTRIPDGIVRDAAVVLQPGGAFLLDARTLVLFQHSRKAELS